MAIGDMVSDHVTLLPNQFMTINPSVSSVEWIVHNIYIPIGSTCEFYKTNGSTATKFMIVSNSLLSYNFHCSSDSYITVKNVGSNTINVAFDGLIMQE